MRNRYAGWLGLCLALPAFNAAAEGVHFESAGVRFGFSSGEGTEAFYQVEVFTEMGLPWQWHAGTNWYFLPQLEFSSGWIGEGSANAFIATSGPRMVFGRERFPLTLIVGTNPTIMTRSQFESRDFGMIFQFTTYAGIECNIGKHVNFGYRFQHMSNAGLASPNPGLNLHMISVGWRF